MNLHFTEKLKKKIFYEVELMLIIIRKDTRLSLKTKFITQLFNKRSNNKVFFVFKKDNEKFREKWGRDNVQLPSTIIGIITYYLFIMIRSPKEFRNALLSRLLHIKLIYVHAGNGFLSTLRKTLYLYFGASVRTNRLMHMLNKMNSPKVFLIDEFMSINCLDLKKLKLLGSIIYVSQDIAYNQYGFGDNFITRKLMFRLERDAIANFDLIIACSEMERLKYLEMGARKAIFYPNIYPTVEYEPCDKDEKPAISIVLRDHWGFRAKQSLETIFNALSCLDQQIKVYLIGIKPLKIPKNIILEYHEFVQDKLDYLKILGKSWIGINFGIHKAGTNGRKYEYAEAGTVVFSDILGVRGDLLPYEYTFVDYQDLAAKLGQLLEFGKFRLLEMGKENRGQVLSMAEAERQKLLENVSMIIAD